jgi:hypothetical protein
MTMKLELSNEEMEAVRDGMSAALHLLLTLKTPPKEGEGLTVAASHLRSAYKALWTAEAILTDARAS